MKKLIRRASNLIKSWIDYISSKGNHKIRNIEDTIIISGAPRSGTTWLMEILSVLPAYKTIFEPLHKTWFPFIQRLNLPPRVYLPPERDNAFLYSYLYNVFKGEVISRAPKYSLLNLDEVYRRLTASKIIVKFVNGNRLLPWISERFYVRGTYLIIRHPCATILSQIRTGWLGYPVEIERRIKSGELSLLKEIILREVFMIPEVRENSGLIRKIQNLNTIEELLAVEWSLDYFVPLLHFNKYSWYLLPYERLLVQLNEEVELLFAYIDQQPPEKIWKKLRLPSKTAMVSSQINSHKQLLKWKKGLTERQIRNILKVTNWFGMDFYTENPEPDYNALKNWKPPF